MIGLHQSKLFTYESLDNKWYVSIQRKANSVHIESNIIDWEDHNVIVDNEVLVEVEVGLYMWKGMFINRKRTKEEQIKALRIIETYRSDKKLSDESYMESTFLFCPSIEMEEIVDEITKEEVLDKYYSLAETSNRRSSHVYSSDNLSMWLIEGDDFKESDTKIFIFCRNIGGDLVYDAIISDLRNYAQLGTDDIVYLALNSLNAAVDKIQGYLGFIGKKAVKLSDREGRIVNKVERIEDSNIYNLPKRSFSIVPAPVPFKERKKPSRQFDL
jgi:hypothetical protein